MSQAIKAALRAATFQAIAAIGEKLTREIVDECFATIERDHWGRR